MNFRKVNNITGWAIFIIAFATYFLTREARGSLWDCGEFVASAAKMQLPHPPGAPLFTLLGRFFIILFGDNGQTAANAVNFMSALASAGTIVFLFWTITHFARKMFVSGIETLAAAQLFTVMAAGVVGALAYTFSDSFFFSAVEGEVYALSSFFTALVFWAILKWEHADESAAADLSNKARADRWIVFLFFMVGLSIGVHLLNLLTIPAIVMVYYYRRYQATTKGAIVAFLVGCFVTGLVQVAAIQYSMKAAGQFDIFFVNKMHMPLFSGFAIYFLLLATLIFLALRFNEKNLTKWKMMLWWALFLSVSLLPFITSPVSGSSDPDSLVETANQSFSIPVGSSFLNVMKFCLIAGIGVLCGYFIKARALKIFKLSLWAYSFIMIGYFMYFTALIRANANPTINMNDVNNPISLVYYLSREQYGSAPLVYGPHFLAEVKRQPNGSGYALPVLKEGEMRYVRDKNKYVEIGREREYVYESGDQQIFPRIWDASNDQFHFDTYIDWLPLETVESPTVAMVAQTADDGSYVQLQDQAGKTETVNIPENFSLRVRRGQVVYPGDKLAVKKPSTFDNLRWFFTYQNGFMYWRYFLWNFSGKQNDLQGGGNKRDGNWQTGISFVDNIRLGDQSKMPKSLKMNKANNKLFLLPFILGIVGCAFQFIKNRKDWIVNFLLFFFTGIAIVFYLNQPGSQPRERDYAYVGSFYVFAVWIGLAVVAFARMAKEKTDKAGFSNTLIFGSGLSFLIMLMSTANESFKSMVLTAIIVTAIFAAVTTIIIYLLRALGKSSKTLNIATAAICMIAPIIMAQQEWDDHDRHQKTIAPDIAKNYLESCAPNAILFTFGDNDTYPLWYAQEVEGVRPDIRIINNSLLGIDWYINQLRNKVNDAPAVPITLTPQQIEGHNREYLFYQANSSLGDKYYPLSEVMSLLAKPDIDPATGRDTGPETYPVKKFSLPVDTILVRKNGTVNPDDIVLPEIKFEPGSNSMQRNALIMLNIIAANNWNRPIYFTAPFGELGFSEYLRKDGLSYRLVPVAAKHPEGNWKVNTAMRELRLGGIQVRDNNIDTMFKNLITKYEFGGADKSSTYYDEVNRQQLLSIRSVFAEAAGNLSDVGKKEEAGKLLDKVDSKILTENVPYAMASKYNNHNQTALVYLEACFKAGKKEMADKVRAAIRKDLIDQQRYYDYLKSDRPEIFGSLGGPEYQINGLLLQVLDRVEKEYGIQPPGASTTSGTEKVEKPIETPALPKQDSPLKQ